MEQKKVDKVIRKTFDYLAEVLDEEQDETARKGESTQEGKNPFLHEGEKLIEVTDVEK